MAVIAAGQPAPEFSLARADGDAVHATPTSRARRTRAGLLPVRVLAGLHRPAAASTTRCSADFAAAGATLYGVSCDATYSQQAFRSSSASTSSSCRTSSPRARPAARSACCTRAGSRSARSCSIGPDGVVGGATRPPSPGDLPGANLIFDALAAKSGLSDLGSAPLPPVGPADHVRGPDADAPRDRRLRRLRVPVLRGARAAAARAAAAGRVPALPGPLAATRAPGAAACAAEAAGAAGARSGRCTTRCSPTRAGSRTRTCGSAPSGSASTSRASTPTAAPSRSQERIAADFRGGVRGRRRDHADALRRTASATPGAQTLRSSRRWRTANSRIGVYLACRWPPTPS